MGQVAILLPEDKITIKNKGIVLISILQEGVVLIGNYIKFKCDGISYEKKIIGIEMIRRASLISPIPDNVKQSIGVLIECENEVEILKLGEAKLNREKAIVYKVE